MLTPGGFPKFREHPRRFTVRHPLLPPARRECRSSSRARAALAWTLIAAVSALGCADDGADAPSAPNGSAPSSQAVAGAIIVGTAAELAAALTPDNAGRRILVRAGSYAVTTPLTVPDGATLEGEGVMQIGGDGLPVGFGSGPRTTLTMSANVPGTMLRLGHRATLRRLQIADLADRAGNVVAILSRSAGDRVSASIVESEIINLSPMGANPDGPTGNAVLVLTQNPNLGAAPAAHESATITALLDRSLVRSPAGGVGLFAFNFAAQGRVSVSLAGSVVGGGIVANGGVSRPDAVHDAEVTIESHGNLYRDDSPDPCATPHLGWNLTGGSGPPAPLPVPETSRNALRVHSVDDRVEGFANGVVAAGSRRFFPAPIAGPSTGNRVELTLLRGTISTPSCGGAPFVRDFDLAGALAGGDDFSPGDGNSVFVILRGMTGSGTRFNRYESAQGASGPLAPDLAGGNRLEFAGSPRAFAATNTRIDPAPGIERFTGARP
jgi:hypothetical protein